MANKPIQKISNGRVSCAVWEGEYKGNKTYSFSFQKSYKGEDGWKNTGFFSMSDLHNLRAVCDYLIMKDIMKKSNGKKNEQKKSEDVPFDNGGGVDFPDFDNDRPS